MQSSSSSEHTPPGEPALASRAGLKMQHALQSFAFPVTGLVAADFGCNVGGFTDVLLRAGAAKVFAVDTGYGTLAWRLRQDARVVTMERTNALHAERPEGGVDLVVLDLAWTPQRLAIPAALRWLRPSGHIISLVKPHYELRDEEKSWLVQGFLPHERVPPMVDRVRGEMPAMGARVLADTASPITGGKSAKRAGSPGNMEWLMLLAPIGA
jgi:23S rRNA (cytidine1920-2'-O)/16S rRNA (cytidine1409-2'-O)-methyltransferase